MSSRRRSRRLTGATPRFQGPLADTIASLKQQPGQTIGVAGSPTLVRSLLQADLLDELILMIHPVIVGAGKRLFKDGDPLQRLKVVDSQTTRSGVLNVTYRPRRDAE
jgi:dihydrofolate reductase